MIREVKRVYIPEDELPLTEIEEVEVFQSSPKQHPRYVGCEGKLIIASGEDANCFHN